MQPVASDEGDGKKRGMKVLISGGAGYIGSTVASACIDAGISPVILDSLITGRREFVANRTFYHGDIADGAVVDRVFAEHPEIYARIDAQLRQKLGLAGAKDAEVPAVPAVPANGAAQAAEAVKPARR